MDDDDYTIFIFSGVSFEFCITGFEFNIEDDFTNQIESGIEQDEFEDTKEYVKPPDKFTTLTEWATETNIKCWFCRLSFKGRPKFIPHNIEADHPQITENTKYKIITEGVFCSWNCVVAYIKSQTQYQKNREKIIDMVYFTFSIFEGKQPKHIEQSPQPEKYLREYGGRYEPYEYKKILARLVKENPQR